MANALRRRILILCFTWLLFCSVLSENRLLFVGGQFLHLENEGKPSLSLPKGGYPLQASREAMGQGWESWLTAALT